MSQNNQQQSGTNSTAPELRLPIHTTPWGFFWSKQTNNGPVPIQLTNFVLRIVAEVEEDDGVEQKRWYEMESTLRGRPKRFRIPAAQFSSMNWVPEHLGSGAIIFPEYSAKD